MRRVFRGHDELTGMTNALLWFAATTLALVAALVESSLWWGGIWVCGVLLTPVIWFGARYRLEVGDRGVWLTKYLLWPLGRRKRYYLDCAAALYEAWESDRPEGVFLDTGSLHEDSDVFGPYFDVSTMGRLAREVNDAITASRRLVDRPRELQAEGLDPADFEVLERALGGPPRVVRNRRRLRLRGFEVPAGSEFMLHYADWVDPARTDTIRSIKLAGPTTLPSGLEVEDGADVSFFTTRPTQMTVRGLSHVVQIGGAQIRGGQDPVTLEGDEAVSFRLAAPLQRGDFCLPAGSSVRRWELLGEEAWSVELGAAMEVAGVTAQRGDFVTFNSEWRPIS